MREIIVRLSINRKRTKEVLIFRSHIHFKLFEETICLKSQNYYILSKKINETLFLCYDMIII